MKGLRLSRSHSSPVMFKHDFLPSSFPRRLSLYSLPFLHVNGASATALRRMTSHSAGPETFKTRSHMAADFCEPPYDFMKLPLDSNVSEYEHFNARRGGLGVPILQQRQSLPSINSILHRERTAPIRRASPQQLEYSSHKAPFTSNHAPTSRFWGRQSVTTESFWSQAYVDPVQIPLSNATPLLGRLGEFSSQYVLIHIYRPQFQMPNWHGRRIEHSQFMAESNSPIERLDGPPVDVLKCEYIDPLNGHSCASVFSRHDCLLRHKRTVHSPGRAKWECRLCDGHRNFTRHDSLARHMRQIHGVFNFPGKQRSSI